MEMHPTVEIRYEVTAFINGESSGSFFGHDDDDDDDDDDDNGIQYIPLCLLCLLTYLEPKTISNPSTVDPP